MTMTPAQDRALRHLRLAYSGPERSDEIVFNRPGLGKIIVGALGQRDYTMLQGLMVIYCFLIVIVNLLTDLAYGFIDPRVKHA